MEARLLSATAELLSDPRSLPFAPCLVARLFPTSPALPSSSPPLPILHCLATRHHQFLPPSFTTLCSPPRLIHLPSFPLSFAARRGQARFTKDKLGSLMGPHAKVFLDSDDLNDLNRLLDHVRATEVLVLFQTAGVLTRP